MGTNNIHREVGLQPKLKMVISLLSAMFLSKADVERAIAVINRVAGADTKVGFWTALTGVGTILGNVMIIDLNIPLMAGHPRNEKDEAVFNKTVAKALIAEFGRLNVGYLTPEPVVTRRVRVEFETESTDTQIAEILREITSTVEIY